ncbi:recombinase family protein [Marinomonas communis]|uniref:DNA invertase Pin-like site-specific DNA recombinase n=1 Tax=Marinomonas communis TaxID=28254 RepID=A0A4R6X276_9GAMM|nr:recombinase family protein [Marinomonas communis]TDR05953.1 DNA invertase Pin-like site-specific DNA recombinase [Marinomonas communis]
MATVAYVRISSDGQSNESQKHQIAKKHNVDKWFADDAVSGVIKSSKREGMKALLEYVREGDTVIVSAIDRLGRHTIDVLETVDLMQSQGVSVVSLREGFDLSTPIGKAMLTMLSAVAELERSNIKARQMAGIERARAEGRNLGKEKVIDDEAVASWRASNQASIKTTADHFGISTTSVKRACRAHKVNI